MNNKGQIIAEYMLLISVVLIILFIVSNTIIEENEKNTILTAAQIGAQIGADKNGYAMYYNDTFNNYEENYNRLLYPTEIKVINITLKESNNTLYIQATLHSNEYLTSKEEYIIGYRVNYYIRKSVVETLNLNVQSPYNNIQTKKFKIKNSTIKWVY